jgi:PTS system nitrogen regulatory IIA component
MLPLDQLTRPDLIFAPLAAESRGELLQALAGRLAAQGLVADAGELCRRLAEREDLGSTGVGGGVAIPHCKLPGLARPLLAIGVAAEPGIEFGASDGKPVRLFFLVVSPTDAPAEHLQVLAAISRWVRADSHAERVLASDSPQSILRLLRQGQQP